MSFKTVQLTREVPVYCLNLCKVREDMSLRQDRVAHLMGISQSQFSRYESGESEPSISMFVKWCDALCVSPDEMLEWY